MGHALRRRLHNLLEGLWFVPTLVAAGLAVLAVVLVQEGHVLGSAGAAWAFDGDAPAARSVLSTIAGSLITVAGLTFSITIIVLQLTASQLTPRALRNVFADRLTQVTIGMFVGTFAYCLVLLRAVRDASDGGTGFVPRVGVTVSIVFALLAVALLIVFVHHVSQLVQVSHVAARVAGQTLAEVERLHPDTVADGEDGAVERPFPERRGEPGGVVYPVRPGFVTAVGLDQLAGCFEGCAGHVHVLVCPGDFVGLETPLAVTWPGAPTHERAAGIRSAIAIANERTLDSDALFGVRQLADIAIRALSPSLNDPTTAVTCIAYLRTILVRLATRRFTPTVLRRGDVVVVASARSFDDYLADLLEVGEHARGDARVTGHVLAALGAVARVADAAGARRRSATVLQCASSLARAAEREARSPHEFDLIRAGAGEPARAPNAATDRTEARA